MKTHSHPGPLPQERVKHSLRFRRIQTPCRPERLAPSDPLAKAKDDTFEFDVRRRSLFSLLGQRLRMRASLSQITFLNFGRTHAAEPCALSCFNSHLN